jgi:hypothetical protein
VDYRLEPSSNTRPQVRVPAGAITLPEDPTDHDCRCSSRRFQGNHFARNHARDDTVKGFPAESRCFVQRHADKEGAVNGTRLSEIIAIL